MCPSVLVGIIKASNVQTYCLVFIKFSECPLIARLRRHYGESSPEGVYVPEKSENTYPQLLINTGSWQLRGKELVHFLHLGGQWRSQRGNT